MQHYLSSVINHFSEPAYEIHACYTFVSQLVVAELDQIEINNLFLHAVNNQNLRETSVGLHTIWACEFRTESTALWLSGNVSVLGFQ